MLGRLFYTGPTIDELHEEYAKRGRIDEQAQMWVRREVVVAAPAERVWRLLSDAPGWPGWYSPARDVALAGELAVDTRFTWASGGARMRSRFAVLDPGREVTWTGQSMGAKAVHRHVLEPGPDGGGTLVRCEESMAGRLLPLIFSTAKLEAVIDRWLAALKAEAERG
jgi:uncharacterized protein YndB with AHSA1/START domain